MSNSNALGKDEYEKILLHGANKIMAAKTDMLSVDDDIDIEALIEEGLEKNRKVQEMANEQADKIAEELRSNQDGFDMTVGRIDMFKFQD